MDPMKRALLGAVLVAASGGAAFVACDLFHSTNFATLCEVNPEAGACRDGDAGTDFCSWTSAQALSNAQHACAWLSACESPLGNNDFGPCMIEALLAYDCTANPNRPVLGKLHVYWDTLWSAQKCEDVDRVVFPGRVPQCGSGGGFAACGVNNDGGSDNSTVRVECYEAGPTPAGGENCLAQGRTCRAGSCVTAPSPCGVGCSGTTLRVCNDAGVDNGTDCQYFGAGRCVDEGGVLACAPSGDASCATQAVVCGNVAQGCQAGTQEQVDCSKLTGTGTCNPGVVSPAQGVASACFVSGEAGICPPDSCGGSGTSLVSCARGQTFSVSCADVGLGPCHVVPTVDGPGPRAACSGP
jgi:hypothetical protein